MKLLELFADKILATSLFEMAMARRDAISKINSLENMISTHIIKSFIFNSHSQTHWYSELDGWISAIEKIELKPSSKRVEKEIYFQCLFNNMYDHGTNVLERQVKSLLKSPQYLKEKRTNIDINDLWKILKQIYLELSADLEIGEFNSGGSQYYIEKYK